MVLVVAVSLYDSLGVIVDSVWVNVTVFATNVTCLGGQCSEGGGGGKPANGDYNYKVTSCSGCNSMYVTHAHARTRTHARTHAHDAHVACRRNRVVYDRDLWQKISDKERQRLVRAASFNAHAHAHALG